MTLRGEKKVFGRGGSGRGLGKAVDGGESAAGKGYKKATFAELSMVRLGHCEGKSLHHASNGQIYSTVPKTNKKGPRNKRIAGRRGLKLVTALKAGTTSNERRGRNAFFRLKNGIN